MSDSFFIEKAEVLTTPASFIKRNLPDEKGISAN